MESTWLFDVFDGLSDAYAAAQGLLVLTWSYRSRLEMETVPIVARDLEPPSCEALVEVYWGKMVGLVRLRWKPGDVSKVYQDRSKETVQ